MSRTLDEWLDVASREVLEEKDLSAFCDLTLQTGRNQEVLVKLLRAGTAAGRTNLTRASTLRSYSRSQVRRESSPPPAPRYLEHVEGLPFTITTHAFERFASRHGRSFDDLMEEARQACPIKDRTINGDEQWVGGTGVTFVLHRDGNKRRPVCVTILPKVDADWVPRPGKKVSRRVGG